MTHAGPNEAGERRRNPALRELLDEMLELVRRLSHEAPGLAPADLAYAQERLEWLADEIWECATKGSEEQKRLE